LETNYVTLGSGSVLGTSATGGSGLPADQTTHAASADLAATSVTLPRGSIWAAQVGEVRPHDFVLLVAGMPFDVDGEPPATQGGTLLVRVVEDTTPPLFEVLAREPQAQNAALRSLLAQLLRRAPTSDHAGRAGAANTLQAASSSPSAIASALQQGAHDQLTRPTQDLTRYLETGALRLDLHVPPCETSTRWHVEIHDPSNIADQKDKPVAATVFVDLPVTGPVEARLTLSASRLRVHFIVDSDDVREHLLAQAEVLTAALSSAGFSGVELAAHADPARLARDRVTDEVPREAPRAGGLLDIRA